MHLQGPSLMEMTIREDGERYKAELGSNTYRPERPKLVNLIVSNTTISKEKPVPQEALIQALNKTINIIPGLTDILNS